MVDEDGIVDEQVGRSEMSRALVTGAGRGIGQAIAKRLHVAGHDIIAVDMNEAAANHTAQLVDGVPFACDITDETQVKATAAAVGPVDVLVNNAGIWTFGPLLESTRAEMERVLAVNLLGTIFCCQAFAPPMVAAGRGAIVNISSGAATSRPPGLQIYPASKAAVEALTGQLALELQPVRVNAVAPGVIGSSTEPMPEDQIARLRDRLPLGRIGTGEDIANAVAFLASDEASYVSGQILQIDGGFAAGRRIF